MYEGLVEQARVSRLEPSSHYRVHVAAKNEAGRSDFTPPLHVNTAPIMQQPPPPSLPTTSANTSLNFYHPYSAQPPMSTAVPPHSIVHPYMSVPLKVSLFFIAKIQSSLLQLPAPTLVSVSARSVRLSWNDTPPQFTSITVRVISTLQSSSHILQLEMADSVRPGPHSFVPVSPDCYTAGNLGANVSNLRR